MSRDSAAATVFGATWDACQPVLRRHAAVLFDDPRLHPAPRPEDLLRAARPIVAARWPAGGPPDPPAWVLREVTQELLGRGWAVYDGALRGVLRRSVWSAADVDDLLQGAAARSVERLGELVARPRPLFGWLCLLARQQRVDWLRRGGGDRVAPAPDGLSDPADTGTTPTQAERRARVRDMYHRVLASLTTDEAELLRLTTERGLGPAAVAGRLGVTELAARQRVFRARCAAARAWQALFPGAAAELAALGVFPPGTVAP
jgi:RNA polymerase sigma factor (sigma-70 family)